MLMGNDCTLNKLSVATNMLPAGTAVQFTVQTGSPTFNMNSVTSGTMSNTPLSCTINDSSSPAGQCTATGSFSVKAGQFMWVQIIISNVTTPAGYYGFWAIGCQ
jgi:hypothetical protein